MPARWMRNEVTNEWSKVPESPTIPSIGNPATSSPPQAAHANRMDAEDFSDSEVRCCRFYASLTFKHFRVLNCELSMSAYARRKIL
jgi:hypothetical protein